MQTDEKNTGIIQNFAQSINGKQIAEIIAQKCDEHRVPVTSKNLVYIWKGVLADVIPTGVEMIIEDEMNKAKEVIKK